MDRRARLLVGCAVAAFVVVAAVWMFWPQGGATGASSLDAVQVARGAALYGEYCASCHGANLEGQPNWRQRKPDGRLPAPPHDASGHTWHHTDDQLFALTKIGLKPPLAPAGYESDMPGFGETLSDDDIRAVLAYIKSRWPDEIRAYQAGISMPSTPPRNTR